MSTCGYTCPKCEGKDYLEDGSPCDWCGEEQVESTKEKVENEKLGSLPDEDSSQAGGNYEVGSLPAEDSSKADDE